MPAAAEPGHTCGRAHSEEADELVAELHGRNDEVRSFVTTQSMLRDRPVISNRTALTWRRDERLRSAGQQAANEAGDQQGDGRVHVDHAGLGDLNHGDHVYSAEECHRCGGRVGNIELACGSSFDEQLA